MTRTVRVVTSTVCVLWIAAIASSDTLTLRDGTRIEGTVAGFAARTLTFIHADGVSRRYPTSAIASLEFLSAERANARPTSRGGLEAPAGAEFVIRTVETIDSRSVGADQIYAAIFEQGIVDADNHVVVPKGASVQLAIRQMSGVDAKGTPEMALDIRSIAIEGRRYFVNTDDAAEQSRGAADENKRPVAPVGRGVARGSILRAIADGTGQSTSDRAGDAGEVLTRGRYVRIPVDTVLVFRVDKRVLLQREE